MSKIEIRMRKSGRVKRVGLRLGEALVNVGMARYHTRAMSAAPPLSPLIPIPDPAPLATDIPPEAFTAAQDVGGTVSTPESRAAGAPLEPSQPATSIVTGEGVTPLERTAESAEREQTEAPTQAKRGRRGGTTYRRADMAADKDAP